MRQFLVSLGISVILLLAAGMAFQGMVGSKKPPAKLEKVASIKKVKTRTITNSNSATEIDITGRLSARDRIQIFAEVGGTFLEGQKSFREGNYFKKGEPLITIDDTEFELNLKAQKSSLMNQITLILADMKTDYPGSFPKWQAYLNDMDVSKPLSALPEPGTEQERYYISAKNIYNLFYSIQSQEKRSEKYTINAPFNGKISEASITEGTLVRAGQKLGEFYNPYIFELEAAVNLEDLDFVRPGSRVILSSSDIEGSWKGTVRRISDVVDAQTQTAKVFITVTGKGLKEGMYLEGNIKGATINDVVEISRVLLQDDTMIWIVDGGKLQLHPITPVQYSTNSALVKGIPNGTIILDESIIGGFEGMEVESY